MNVSGRAQRGRAGMSLVFLCLLWLAPVGIVAASVAFGTTPERDSAGFFTLDWTGAERFELEQATGPTHEDARIIYSGPDASTLISGLPDGEYRFRIRALGEAAWSDEAVVVVEHHGLGRAFLFFLLGAGLFAVLILAIAAGRRLA
jgi:hypothetical protein